MEYINQAELESFQAIIAKIKEGHAEVGHLEQKIKAADDEIIAFKISQSKDKFQEQLCNVKVKIFNNVFDLHNLYKEDLQIGDLIALSKKSGQKYYLVEMYISKLLIDKVLDTWQLSISVRNKDFNINKVLNLKAQTPLLEVIPVDKDVIDCQVNVKLWRRSEEQYMTIPLCKMNIDISYHFETYKEDSDNSSNNYEKWTDITRLYNSASELQCIFKPAYFEYKINGNLSSQDFIKLFLRNSYHRLDIELLSELSSTSGKSVNLAFTFRNNNRCIIKYDPKSKAVKLKCTAEDLCLLKEALLKTIPTENYFCDTQKSSPKESLERLSQDTNSFEVLKGLYEGYRQSVHQAPL